MEQSQPLPRFKYPWVPTLPRKVVTPGSSLNYEFWEWSYLGRRCLPLYCPSIKGICAQATPSHLGLLLTQCGSERQTDVPVCAWLRRRGSAAGAEVLMGLLPSQTEPAPPDSSLLPRNASSSKPQHASSMSLATDLSSFDKHPTQPLGLWLFRTPSFMWLGTGTVVLAGWRSLG